MSNEFSYVVWGCVLLLAAYGGLSNRLSAEDLRVQLTAATPPLVIDVRSDLEYRYGHVPGAHHLPFWSVLWRWPEVSEGRAVVLYCEHGPRAVMARLLLLLRGVVRVQLLQGHMHHWRAARYPLET
ncbi:MAG: rhodanese-like domain-containing protein [Desulfuromonadaceae bacterium]|nr:rhodanese-like domain-containing protein [Desulfuromonadaceae bacterium]